MQGSSQTVGGLYTDVLLFVGQSATMSATALNTYMQSLMSMKTLNGTTFQYLDPTVNIPGLWPTAGSITSFVTTPGPSAGGQTLIRIPYVYLTPGVAQTFTLTGLASNVQTCVFAAAG